MQIVTLCTVYTSLNKVVFRFVLFRYYLHTANQVNSNYYMILYISARINLSSIDVIGN